MSIQYDFRGRVIAVTGGGSGIGRATVLLLARSGARVSICDLHQEVLNDLVSEISQAGGEAMAMVVDVSNAAQVQCWIAETVKQWGKIDGAANAAGVIGRGINKDGVGDLQEEDWEFVLRVNLTGVMYCMREQLNEIKDEGSIVNVASIAATMGFAKNAPYSAAKHGTVGLSRSAAKEVGGRRIRVNCIAP
jgi:NAD(P)-dependent dehydrogenase (short-subunit alcohol dehydrogenase family)